MKVSIFSYPILVIILMFSCTEEVHEPIATLQWVPSELSNYRANFYSFNTGDDGLLYAAGYLNGIYGVSRFVKGNWEMYVELDVRDQKFVVQDFEVFQEYVYFVNYERILSKAKGNIVDKIPFGKEVTSVSILNNRIVISGDFTDTLNNPFGLAYSGDGITFISVAPVSGSFTPGGYVFNKSNDKLYIRSKNYQIFEYDGKQLRNTETTMGFDLVDNKGYSYMRSNSGGKAEIIKWKTEDVVKRVGDLFGEGLTIDNIFFKDETLVVIGTNSSINLSVAYFFNGTEWKSISTTNLFFGSFKFKDGIFAYTSNGIIVELTHIE